MTTELLNKRIQQRATLREPSNAEIKISETLAPERIKGQLNSADEFDPWIDEADAMYRFKAVSVPYEVEALLNSMRSQKSVLDRWPYDIWLERAQEGAWSIVTVRRAENVFESGFLTFRSSFLDVSASDGGQVTLFVNLNSIYITPDERGKGCAKALASMIGGVVQENIDQLKNAPQHLIDRLMGREFVVLVAGEAHSEGGARFLEACLDRVIEVVERNGSMSWFGEPTVVSNMDLDRFNRLAVGL